ncbi:DUF4123 domain-containing protein [Xenorhabdus szentirmaii]|uniref:DUF4123 domain-containing protein n=1 Tax=Xenorhabdus szentirmaii TaxID=290112 RepID=UPI0019955E59|nr:DUF4123 domain-containing protein [Xenorhabdus sp. CUL]MBD2794022.1 DUF4123 domain-containing protein [Xenorhabdus sp. CUL]
MTIQNDHVSYDYSEEQQQQQSQRIIEQISKEAEKYDGQCCLLVDPTLLGDKVQYDPLIKTIVSRQPHPVLLPHEKLGPIAYPWLISLDLTKEEDQILLADSVQYSLKECRPSSLRRGAGRAVCGWIMTENPLNQLANHIGETAIQSDANNFKFFFRFYDPAVLPYIWHELTEWQKYRMIAGIGHWIIINGDGEPILYKGGIQQPNLVFNLALSENQIQSLSLISTINKEMVQYRFDNTENRLSEAWVIVQILPALKRIQQTYPNQDDISFKQFTQLAMSIHPEFDLHPKVNNLIKQDTVKNALIDWFSIQDKFSDKAWETIISECQKNSSKTQIINSNHEEKEQSHDLM